MEWMEAWAITATVLAIVGWVAALAQANHRISSDLHAEEAVEARDYWREMAHANAVEAAEWRQLAEESATTALRLQLRELPKE